MRKGHRHLAEGKGRAAYGHSVGKKWLHRQQPELPGPRKEPRRYRKGRPDLDLCQDLDDSEPFWVDESDFESTECDWEDSWSEVSYCSAPSRQSTCASISPTRWEEAQHRAESIAKQYKKPVAPAKLQVVQVAPVEPVEKEEPVVSRAPALASPPVGHGAPPLPELHDEVLAFAGPEPGPRSSRPIPEGSAEYAAVTEYFKLTVGIKVEIKSVTKLNASKFDFKSGQNTVMFHGCRSQQNEDRIVRNGFQVSECRSGGRDYGTWFAYGAAYSNAGYSFIDSKGFKHLFISVVSYAYTVMDNVTMRVVGQGCAYPQWLVTYSQPPPPPRPSYNYPVRPKTENRGRDRSWYVVRDGEWVLETG